MWNNTQVYTMEKAARRYACHLLQMWGAFYGEAIVEGDKGMTKTNPSNVIMFVIGMLLFSWGIAGVVLGFHNMDLSQNLSRLAVAHGMIYDITTGGDAVSLQQLYTDGAAMLLRSLFMTIVGALITCISADISLKR